MANYNSQHTGEEIDGAVSAITPNLDTTASQGKLKPLGANNQAIYIDALGKFVTCDPMLLTAGGVMTGNLKFNTGYNIVAGEDNPSGEDFTISAKHTPTSSEHSIVLTKVGAGSGIKFIQKANSSSYGQGYHQLPVNDGSNFNNNICFTLATEHYVENYHDATKSEATNLENGTGSNAIQQKSTGESNWSIECGNTDAAQAHYRRVDATFGATNKAATSFGGKSEASGSRAFATGSGNAAKASSSAVFGMNSVIDGAGAASFSAGQENYVSGVTSFAFGSSNEVLGNGSFVFGDNCKNAFQRSVVMGLDTEATANDQTIIGTCLHDTVPAEMYFATGYGDDTFVDNTDFAISKDHKIYLKANKVYYTKLGDIQSESDEVATKQYVDTHGDTSFNDVYPVGSIYYANHEDSSTSTTLGKEGCLLQFGN